MEKYRIVEIVASQNRFSEFVTVLRDRRLPTPAIPAGYAALLDAYDLEAPLPRTLCATGERHKFLEEGGWRVYSPRYAPAESLAGHLTFALKHEGLDLTVLKRLFAAIGPAPIEHVVREKPTGAYSRRIWFLYEWLTGCKLDLPNADRGAYAPVVDSKLQYAGSPVVSRRHRVKNNLPGTPKFCPLAFRTQELERFAAMDLQAQAREAIAAAPRDLIARTAAFLLLQDAKASFAIEGERGPQTRIQRWGRAIGQAGLRPIDTDELLRLQRIVIGDARFVRLGLRTEGGFVGEHDWQTGMPVPAHISACPEDLADLIEGLIAFDQRAQPQLDPVVAAAVLAFGFVNVHPLEDGNGRLHRYLIHHVLARRGFSPEGLVLPVSAAILERIGTYRAALEDYSKRVLPAVNWEPTEQGNVRVRNDTADFYRFFDATRQAEFLYECVRQTIEQDLPRETEFLRKHDAFRAELNWLVDMPARLVDLLFRFLRQNGGQLSKRARQKEFAPLTDAEAARIEAIYREVFGERFG